MICDFGDEKLIGQKSRSIRQLVGLDDNFPLNNWRVLCTSLKSHKNIARFGNLHSYWYNYKTRQKVIYIYNMALGKFFTACLTPKSPRISSAPPKIESNL